MPIRVVEAVSPIGVLLGPCLLHPDTTLDEKGIYKTKLKVLASDPLAVEFHELLRKVRQEEYLRQVQEAESKKKGSGKNVRLLDLPVEATEEGDVDYLVFNFRLKARYTDRDTGQTMERKIVLFDSTGEPVLPKGKVCTGSIARISVFIAPFYNGVLGAGVILRIRAVKVVKLMELPTLRASDFGFSEEREVLAISDCGPVLEVKMTPRLKDRDRTDLIVVHCSATGPKSDIGKREITQWHLKRGFVTIGYHYVIRRDGTIEQGRRETEIGAHVSGHNSNSIGVCMVGGVDAQGKPSDNFTESQYESLKILLGHLSIRYGDAQIVGHRDLSPGLDEGVPEWRPTKCPGFDVKKWLEDQV